MPLLTDLSAKSLQQFKCGNLVDSMLPLSEKREMCEQPLNPTVTTLEAACRSVARKAGVAEGAPFVTSHAIGGCYTESGLAQFSSERPAKTYAPTGGEERLGAIFSLAEALTHQKFGIPKPDGAVGAFMAMADWTTLLDMANSVAPDAVTALTAAPACSGVQCTNTDYATDLTGQVPDWYTETLLVEVCPASCGGCGMMGKMVGTSIKALEMVDATTGTAMNDARTVNIDASNAALNTADNAFDQTSSTVGSSFTTIGNGASNVAGGIDSACDTLDDWAPLINAGAAVGGAVSSVASAFSGFRRLREEEEQASFLARVVNHWTSGGNLPAQIDGIKAELAEAFSNLPKRGDPNHHHPGLEEHSRRRLGAQETCRESQGQADDLVNQVDTAAADSARVIGESRDSVATGINQAKFRVQDSINQAEIRIRDSIRSGRDQMIEGFEMTRRLCNNIRDSMGAVRNTTESVFDFMASGCEMIVTTMADPPGNADGAYAAVESMMRRLQTPVELGIGLKHALMGFKIMIPAAVAIAPGLMKGALAVKMLVPQSSLPGVFVVLLPWLYCPIMWCLYNFAFQLIGDPFMLAGLLLLAYAPMVNVIIGEWKAISQPMNDAEILTVTKVIERYGLMAQVIAVFCIAMFIYKMRDAEELEGVDKKQTAKGAIDQMLEFQVVLSMLVSSISKKFYTTLAGVDYMISTIVEDRRFEIMLKTFKRPPQSKGCCGRKKKEGIHGEMEESSESDDADSDEEAVGGLKGESKVKDGKGCCGKDERSQKHTEVPDEEGGTELEP